MKVQYYVIPVDDNTESCVNSLVTHQGAEDVHILKHNDVSQVLKVAYMQNYDGYAVVCTSDHVLTKPLDLDKICCDLKCMCFNKHKTLFVINCSSSLLVNAFSPRVVESVDLNQYMSFQNIGNPGDWVLMDDLDNHFTVDGEEVIDIKDTDLYDEVVDQLVDDFIQREDENEQ